MEWNVDMATVYSTDPVDGVVGVVVAYEGEAGVRWGVMRGDVVLRNGRAATVKVAEAEAEKVIARNA